MTDRVHAPPDRRAAVLPDARAVRAAHGGASIGPDERPHVPFRPQIDLLVAGLVLERELVEPIPLGAGRTDHRPRLVLRQRVRRSVVTVVDHAGAHWTIRIAAEKRDHDLHADARDEHGAEPRARRGLSDTHPGPRRWTRKLAVPVHAHLDPPVLVRVDHVRLGPDHGRRYRPRRGRLGTPRRGMGATQIHTGKPIAIAPRVPDRLGIVLVPDLEVMPHRDGDVATIVVDGGMLQQLERRTGGHPHHVGRARGATLLRAGPIGEHGDLALELVVERRAFLFFDRSVRLVLDDLAPVRHCGRAPEGIQPLVAHARLRGLPVPHRGVHRTRAHASPEHQRLHRLFVELVGAARADPERPRLVRLEAGGRAQHGGLRHQHERLGGPVVPEAERDAFLGEQPL